MARRHQADPGAPRVVICGAGRNRVSTLVNLTFRYVAWGHGGAVIVGDDPGDSARLSGPRAEIGRDGPSLYEDP
jgi:hypothetical protein